MATTEVETIGVRLTLDASGFAGGADKATSSMNAFTAAAERAVSGAGQMKALGGAQVAGGGKSAAGPSSTQMAAVNVPLTVNAESLASLRAQIIKGLGSIPINITPTVAKAIANEAKSVVSAVSTPAIGTRSGAARAVETAVRNNLPTRAHGGAVQQGRPTLVGEERAEVYIPHASGTIHPDAERYHREQAQARKREAELAALEYQQQRQHARLMGRTSPTQSEIDSELHDRERFAFRARGGNVSPVNAARRARAWDITHAHGNIRGWENAQWRQQEAMEKADAAASLRAEAERERWSPLFPSSNTSAWKHPEKGEPTPDWRTQAKGDPLSIWGDEHRAHGGPAHKGGLPKGYRIEFYSPQQYDFDIRNFGGRLDKPGSEFKSVKKPPIMAKQSVAGLIAVVMKGDKVAASFPFSYNPAHEQWGVPTPYGAFHPDYSLTGIEHRRKGLATAAYMKVERFTGRPIAPSSVQLTRGKAFWSQPNRPFGKIFGPRPVDPQVISTAAREEAMDQSTLEFERRQAARARSTAPGPNIVPTTGLMCPTCGTAAGPYTSQANLDVHMSLQHGAPPSTVAAASRASAPVFGQPMPTREPRRPRRNDPQEQMRRASNQYRDVDPWAPRVPVSHPAAPAFGEGSFEQARSFTRRARGGAVEISRLPGGGGHYAQRPEGFYRAIQDTISHYQEHSAPGGYVGVAPVGRGMAVQLHAPSGDIESWRILRNLKHAGFGALAYRQTMNPEIEGGTFPLAGGPQPPKGYAVGIDTGTSHLVPSGAPRAFLKAFHEQRRSQIAAGNFPPYVGTWLHEGQIHIDPAAVLGRKREADMVARAKAQMAFFDLKRFDEVPTSSKKLRANAERIQQLIMSGRKRMAGGPVENVRLATLMPLRREDREIYPRTGQGATDLGELTSDIAARGIQRPIALRYDPTHHAAMVDDGNHRLAVARRLGIETVPAYAISSGPQSKRHHKLVGLTGSPVDAPRGALLAPSALGLRHGGGLVHAKQGAVAARMTPEEMDYVGNLRDAATRISPDQLKFGKVWYSDAQKWIKEQAARYGIDPTTARGVTAALSAGTAWGANKSKAHKIFSTHGQGLFGESFPYSMNLDAHKKAKAIIEGANPEKILGHTPKVGQFYRNLGGDLDAVTLDRWAYRTATRGHLSQYGKGPIRRDIDAAYRKVAGELGLHPVEFQAAAWLYEKGANPRSGRRGKPQSLGQLESMFSPNRARGGPALGGLTPPLNQIAHPGFASSMFQTAADWANDPFMAIMAWQQQAAAHKAEGGPVLGPLQRRLLGLKDSPKAEIPQPVQPFEPEWLKRARESRLPPKIYRAGGGPVSHLFTVADQLGLHMRPSAHLARMAADYDAFITVENLTRGMPQKGVAEAKYMHHLLALGARQGDQLRIRATGNDAETAVRGLGGLIESPGLTRLASANRSLEKVDPQRMRAAEIFSKFTGRKDGGDSPKGLYIVGEIGEELFVPNRLTHLIPKKVMDQIPKAAGGMQIIGKKPNSLFSPPEDGIIVPNRLMDQVPHAARGTRAEKMRAAAQEAMARADVYGEQGPIPFLEAGPAPSRPLSRRPQPHFADAEPAVIEIERAVRRAAIEKEVVAARRGARTAFPVQRDSRATEELLVQRAGAGKLMPSRTAQGAIASVASFLFGGVQGITRAERERVEAANAYSKTLKTGSVLISKTRAEHEIYYNAFKKETEGVAKGSEEYTRAQEDYHTSVRKLIPAIHEQNAAEAERFTTLNAKTEKAMPTGPGVLKNLGVIIGATTAYGMAMQLASTAINDAALPAIGKFVDQFIGFGSTTTRITGDLAKSTQAGNVTQSMAQAASVAGLGTAGLAAAQSLVPSVIAKAGAAAAGQAMDLRRAAYGATMGNAPSGLYGGTGGILGSSLFAEQLGGSKGFLENVAGEAAGYRNQATGGLPPGSAAAYVYGTPNVTPTAAQQKQQAGALVAQEGEFSDYNEAVKRGATAQNESASTLKLMTKETLNTTKGLQNWVAATGDLTALAAQIGGTAPDEVKKLIDAGGVIVDESGKAITNVKDLNKFLTQAAQGTAIASPEAWSKTNLRQIKAQLDMSQAQMERTANLIIPWQVTEQLIGQPLTIPGAAAFPGAAAGAPSGAAAGMSPAAAGQAETWLASARDAQKQLTAIAKGGYDEQLKNVTEFFTKTTPGAGTIPSAESAIPLPPTSLPPTQADLGGPLAKYGAWNASNFAPQSALGGPLAQSGGWNASNFASATAPTAQATAPTTQTVGPEVAQFKALYQTAQTASQAIADTTNALSKIQLTASQTNWANSIRLATRGLGDALAMAGKTGEVAGTALGTWERTSHFLDVAGTKLSLMLSQRQINFQVAVAGFQAPGLTSEERGARQQQAKLEAGVAQKQLNIQTGQFDISQKVWIENANRAAFDASRAIGVMKVARDAEMATVAAQASIAENEKLLAVTTAQMDNIVNKANSDWGTITGAALTGISQFAGGLKEGVKAIYQALGYSVSYNKQGGIVLSGTGLSTPSYSPAASPYPTGGTPTRGFQAAGLLGSYSSPTDVTFGEAGTETVAILRNPRAGSLGGGGASAGPTIVNMNLVVQGDVKDEATVAKIVRAVEDSFNRKAARLGMRSLVSATG